MECQDKTKDQLLKEIAQLKVQNRKFKIKERDHEKVKETLTYQRKLYLDFTNSLPGGIYRIRVFPSGQLEKKWVNQTKAPYEFEFINDGFCKIFKVSRQVAESNPALLSNRIVEADKAEFAKLNSKANIELTPFLWEGRLMIENEIVWIHFESLPILLENGDVIWTGMLYDISEHKKTEQALKIKTKELHKANVEKNKFFSIISHDLRSPLSSIVALSRILAEHVQEKDLEKIEKYSEMIRYSSQNSLDLLTNLIEWSQSQTGILTFNPIHFQIVDVINESLLIFTDIAEQKSIIITSELPSQMTAYADKEMISTILRNLLSNAIKFTNPGGNIYITAKLNQGNVQVSICDTGVGMSKTFIEKTFTIGENRSTSGTQHEAGTGLGLILCKEFIERHKGKIWVESELEKGSIFYFTLPMYIHFPSTD